MLGPLNKTEGIIVNLYKPSLIKGCLSLILESHLDLG